MARVPDPNRDPYRIRADARIGILHATAKPVSKRNPAGPFADLTWPQQQAAQQWLAKFFARWGSDLPPWRRAILTGVAKRLALYPPGPKFARSLARSYSGQQTVRKYRNLGLPYPHIEAMRRGLEWKRAGRPKTEVRHLDI